MTQYRRKRKKTVEVKNDPAQLCEQLDLFSQFQRDVLPELQDDLKRGMNAEQLAKKYSHLAMARMITVMLTESDNSKAVSAAKDVMDRGVGKAVERKKIEHSMADVDDEQLDALILSEIEDISTKEG